MDKEIERLIIKSTLRSVELGILNYQLDGKPIDGKSMRDIIEDIENKADKIYEQN